MKESRPSSDDAQTEKEKWLERKKATYDFIVEDFLEDVLVITPSEAVYLRQLMDDVFNNNQQVDERSNEQLILFAEVEARFLHNYFGIDINDYIHGPIFANVPVDQKKKELYRYITERVRPEMEGEEFANRADKKK